MIVLMRLPDWRPRLEAAIDDIYRRPFDWAAQHDCAIGLAARAVHAVTGEDLAMEWRGRYTSERGALLAMKKAGHEDLNALAASVLPPIHASRARVGDLASFAVDTPFRAALGVVMGERVLVLKPEGIGSMELLAASSAFRVG